MSKKNMLSNNKILSIVIVTYNSERDIFDCIDSILAHNTLGEALEIIVVDNHSTDFVTTAQALRERYPDIVLMENPRNGGYGQGNNIGIKAAKAPIVAIVNPDVRWTTPIMDAMLRIFKDPKIALAGCRQMEDETHAASAIHMIPNATGFEKAIGKMIANRLGIYWQRRMYLSGACFFVRKAVMEEIGGFDEKIFLYSEENDIRYRILALDKGFKIVYKHNLYYIHKSEHRPISETTEQRRIQADLYVLNKQGIHASTYYRTERAKCRWNILLHALAGNKAGIAHQKQILQIYAAKS